MCMSVGSRVCLDFIDAVLFSFRGQDDNRHPDLPVNVGPKRGSESVASSWWPCCVALLGGFHICTWKLSLPATLGPPHCLQARSQPCGILSSAT